MLRELEEGAVHRAEQTGERAEVAEEEVSPVSVRRHAPQEVARLGVAQSVVVRRSVAAELSLLEPRELGPPARVAPYVDGGHQGDGEPGVSVGIERPRDRYPPECS